MRRYRKMPLDPFPFGAIGCRDQIAQNKLMPHTQHVKIVDGADIPKKCPYSIIHVYSWLSYYIHPTMLVKKSKKTALRAIFFDSIRRQDESDKTSANNRQCLFAMHFCLASTNNFTP